MSQAFRFSNKAHGKTSARLEHDRHVVDEKLTKPDSRNCGFNIQVLSSTFAASLSSLNFGWCLGEPNIPEAIIKDCVQGPEVIVRGFPTCFAMSETVWGLVVGLVALGALTGSLNAGRAADRFGRKTVLLANNVFFIVGALLLGTATTVAQLAVGRFVSGIGCGISSTVVATYNCECAPLRVRGFLGVVLQLSVEVGIFLSQIAATILVDVPNWRILFGLSGAISLVQLAWLPFMPESPQYLVRQGNNSAATNALEFLRPNHDVTNEIQEMIQACAPNHSKPNSRTYSTDVVIRESKFIDDSGSDSKMDITVLSETSSDKPPTNSRDSNVGIIRIVKGTTPDIIWHLLFCTMFLMGFQQWTGAKGIVFYSTEILVKALRLNQSQIQQTPNKAQWITIGLAGIGILAVIVSMNLIDRLGRRQLLLISTGGLSLSCLLVVIGTALNLPAILLPSMFAFKLCYGLGMGPIPWLAASEMLPYYALGTLSGIAGALNWSMIFTIGLLFPVISKALGNFLFIPFAALNMVAFVVVLLFIPETRNRQISELLYHHGKGIHRIFHFRTSIRTTLQHTDA